MTLRFPLAALAILASSFATAPQARPVSYADGHLLLAEHQSNLELWRYTYSPSFRWSMSVGGLNADALGETGQLQVDYLRTARLLQRWNFHAAQANFFGWAGLGRARTAAGVETGRHAGFQLDYETTRVYTSLVSELHEGDGWSHRFDTASLGWAPYPHEVDRLATWIVLKGMSTSNDGEAGLKAAAALRLFTTSWWLELGADQDGKPLVNLMVNL